MAPAADGELEREGVLNPAAIRGPDGQLYLYPRLVAEGNYSRIGRARVVFDGDGNPAGVERLGVVLEPEAAYEKNALTGGGVEDPRITYVEPLRLYVMTYTAYSTAGPRVALAASRDLVAWERLGLARFKSDDDTDFAAVDNKDAVLFPRLVQRPDGRPALALIHRPKFGLTRKVTPWPGVGLRLEPDELPRHEHESIWLSYAELAEPHELEFGSHRRLLSPRARWESIKVGAGTAPVLTPHGWLIIYHGVGVRYGTREVRYSAGLLVLDADRPDIIRYRTKRPVLTPGTEERQGILPDVVFPTGLDQRLDIGQSDRFDVYFGMADERIGAAILRLPRRLPHS